MGVTSRTSRSSVGPGGGRRFVEWLLPLPRLAGGVCFQVRLPHWKHPAQTRAPRAKGQRAPVPITRLVNLYHEPRDGWCERCGRDLR